MIWWFIWFYVGVVAFLIVWHVIREALERRRMIVEVEEWLKEMSK